MSDQNDDGRNNEQRKEVNPFQVMPDMNEQEYSLLVETIRASGQHLPIIVDADSGQIVDGHQRLRAAREAGIEPRIESREFDDDDAKRLFAYEINLARREVGPVAWGNLFRRYLAAKGVKLGRGNNQGENLPTVRESVKAMGVSPQTAWRRTTAAEALEGYPKIASMVDKSAMGDPSGSARLSMTRAVAIVESEPELAEKLEAGEISVRDIKKEVGPFDPNKGVIDQLRVRGEEETIAEIEQESPVEWVAAAAISELAPLLRLHDPEAVARLNWGNRNEHHLRIVPEIISWLQVYLEACAKRRGS